MLRALAIFGFFAFTAIAATAQESTETPPTPTITIGTPEALPQSKPGGTEIQIACPPDFAPICDVNEVCDIRGCTRVETCFCGPF